MQQSFKQEYGGQKRKDGNRLEQDVNKLEKLDSIK